mgnify:CR=1 FL=1
MTGKVELSASKVAVDSIYLTLQNILFTLIGVLGYAYISRAITQEEMGVIAGGTLLYSKHVVSALTLRLPLTIAARF